MEYLALCDADAERDLVGAVLLDEIAFERAALKPEEFHLLRFRRCWEACVAIQARSDHVDLGTLEKELGSREQLKEVTGSGNLIDFLVPTLLHVEANAARVHEMYERRRLLARAQGLAQRAADLKIPLPKTPAAVKNHWTMEELLAAEFPEPEGPIPGLIPIGLTVLGGRPKRGKSYLMLQAGGTLAMGGMFLDRRLKLGKVLYYALEDRGRRLQDRSRKLGIAGAALLEFVTELEPLHKGGMMIIEKAVKYGGFAMIVIDTLRRALPGKDFNKDGPLFDDELSQLQTLALENNTSIVVILHTRKSNGGFDPDPVDDVLGSTGLTASADQVLALYTDQGKKGATLKGRGRDVDDVDEALVFDPLTCAWQSLGDSAQAKVRELDQEILEALTDLGKVQVSVVSKTLGKDYSNTHKRISALWVAGKIQKEVIGGKAYFFLPEKIPAGEVRTQTT